MSRSPFADDLERFGAAPASVDAADPEFVSLYMADSWWAFLSSLPHRPEAILAQRRLEEAVYWARRAARPPEEVVL